MPLLSRFANAFGIKTMLIVLTLMACVLYPISWSIQSSFKFRWQMLKMTYRNTSCTRLQLSTMQPIQLAVITEPPQPLCPTIPPGLKGRIMVNQHVPTWSYLEKQQRHLQPGGLYKPAKCTARHRVAIVIPFRDREHHLKVFLQNIHPLLQLQQLDYGIYVIELNATVKFNRAMLMNIGFVEAARRYDYQCFVFHDVDLIPEDDRNLYTCPTMPRHMSASINTHGYRTLYNGIFGGVSALRKEHVLKINGFSNKFFGWGGEDDDAFQRVIHHNMSVIRYSNKVARYIMLKHRKAPPDPARLKYLRTGKSRYKRDGLNSLRYTVIKQENKPLYTWIYVGINMTEVLRDGVVVSVPDKKRRLKKRPRKKKSKIQKNNNNEQRKKSERRKNDYERKKKGKRRNDTPNKIQTMKSAAFKGKLPGSLQQKKAKRPMRPETERVSWIPTDFNGKLPDHLAEPQR